MSAYSRKRQKTDDTNKSSASITDKPDGGENFTECRLLRSSYRSIQTYIRDRKDAIGAASTNKFIEIIDEVDGMHHLVKKPREQVSDAEALRDLSHTLVSSIRVQSLGSVTPSVFVSSLVDAYAKKRRRLGAGEHVQILWKDIGLNVSPLLKIFRGSSTMSGLGPLNRKSNAPEVLFQRKPPEKKAKKLEPVKPKKVESISEEETETDMIIAQMFDILKNKKRVGLENLVLNRISFAQTVENLFVLSFLVKDGRVVIVVDKKGSHYVSPRNAPKSSLIMSKEVVQSHFVFSFGVGDWKAMKDFVTEGSELMPDRSKQQDSSGSGKLESNPKPNTNISSGSKRTLRSATKLTLQKTNDGWSVL